MALSFKRQKLMPPHSTLLNRYEQSVHWKMYPDSTHTFSIDQNFKKIRFLRERRGKKWWACSKYYRVHTFLREYTYTHDSPLVVRRPTVVKTMPRRLVKGSNCDRNDLLLHTDEARAWSSILITAALPLSVHARCVCFFFFKIIVRYIIYSSSHGTDDWLKLFDRVSWPTAN
jgi:hypothetical protein